MTATPIDPREWDATHPPADDFYRHVNGAWLDAHPVPPQYGSYGAFHEVNEQNQDLLHRLLHEAAEDPGEEGSARHKAGDYFLAGTDEATIEAAGIEPLRPLLARIDAITDPAGVRAIAPDLERLGVTTFFGTMVDPDFEDSGSYLMYVLQGGLGLPERDYYLDDDTRSAEIREVYQLHVAAQLRNLGDDAATAEAAARGILAFERRLAEASLTKLERRDPLKTYNRFAVADLDGLMPRFGLEGFLAEVGNTQPTVSVEAPAFLRTVDEAIATTDVATLRHYLRWHLVRRFASSLPHRFEEEAFAFYARTLAGQKEMKPRWKRVLDIAGQDIGELVSQLYVAEAFPPAAKERCLQLVEHLREAMGRAIRTNPWMTDATRAEALDKLASFQVKIGYPDRWRDYSAFEPVHTSFVENRMRAAHAEHQRQVSRLGTPVDTSEWLMPAHIVNAYYNPPLNEIVFPAGILQPPFFWADADDAVNYGGIGTVIGHEITHGFDDQGSRFDGKGHLRDWWTEEDRAEFTRRAEVLAAQYEASHIFPDAHVNGHLTLGENIADLGGLSVAYDGLLDALAGERPLIDGLTPEQRFFASYATIWRTSYTEPYLRLMVNVDPHAPAEFRANIPLSNFPPYAEAFGVPEGTPMARPEAERARIW